MPYNYAHALVGLTALKQLDAAPAALIGAHRGAFLVGTMGPDPYFGDSRPKPLFAACREDLAEKLHTLNARTLFSAMLPLARKSAELQAYTLGFLCHFLLDTNAHPYIEARFSGAAHTPAEIRMDLMIANIVKHPGVPAPPGRFYAGANGSALDALHASLMQALFFMDTRGVFRRSLHKWLAVNAVSYDPDNRKLRFFGGLERAAGYAEGTLTKFLVSHHDDPDDVLNQKRASWAAPWANETERTESMLDLFTRACEEAPAALNAAYVAMTASAPNTLVAALDLIGDRRMDARPV